MNKTANWVAEQNSYTYWYKCSSCGYGVYDGWDGNQYRSKECPRCHSSMRNYATDDNGSHHQCEVD